MRIAAALFGLVPLGAQADTSSFCASLGTEDAFANAECSTSLVLGGGTSFDCSWGFDYRSAEATQAFISLVDKVATCGALITAQDQQVSHPDSYDLRQYSVDGKEVSVSLKDKGALNQTYVFFRSVDLN